jgi:hypothetical protein
MLGAEDGNRSGIPKRDFDLFRLWNKFREVGGKREEFEDVIRTSPLRGVSRPEKNGSQRGEVLLKDPMSEEEKRTP